MSQREKNRVKSDGKQLKRERKNGKSFYYWKISLFFVVFLTAYEEENEGNFLVLIEKRR